MIQRMTKDRLQLEPPITPRRLFTHRVRTRLHEDWKTLRTAVDWVVALYFIVPGLIALGIVYNSWWQHPPAWLAYIPIEGVVIGLFLFTLIFQLRSFLEPADQVFLLQNTALLDAIRRRGLIYSLIGAALTCAVVFAGISPLLVRGYGMTALQISGLAAYTLCWKLGLPVIIQAVRIRMKGWRAALSQTAIILLGAAGFIYSALLMIDLMNRSAALGFAFIPLAGAAALLILRSRLRMRGGGVLLYEIEQERRDRMKLTSFLLAQSGMNLKRSSLNKRRPLILRRSQRLMRRRSKRAVLIEAVIKSYIRSRDQWVFLCQISFLSITALILTGGWWKIIVYIGVVFLLHQGILSYCQRAVDTSYLDLFSWSEWERKRATDDAVSLIALIPASLILLVMIITW